MPEEAVRISLALLPKRGVSAWLFADNQWIITDPEGDYVRKERHDRPVRADHRAAISSRSSAAAARWSARRRSSIMLAECENRTAGPTRSQAAHAHRSQPYYLDVTHPTADKGTARVRHRQVVWRRYRRGLRASATRPTTCRCSTSPGSASRWATHRGRRGRSQRRITDTNEEEGWAKAIERFVLHALGAPRWHDPAPRSLAAAGRRRRHAGHQGEGADRARAAAVQALARPASVRHHQRPAAAGMEMLIEPLRIDTPIAGFNGGLFVKPDLSIIESHTLDADVARARRSS